MINWPDIKPALTSLVTDLAEIPLTSVYWMDQSQANTWGAEPSIGLRVSSVTNQGIEQELRSSNDLNDETIVVAGQRRFMFSIIAMSFTQDIADANFAGNVAGLVSTRLMRSTSHARLAGLCAIETRLPVKWTSFQSQNRQVSAYVLDVLMRTVDNDVDTTFGAGDFINEVVMDGQTVDTSAGPVSPQPHIDVVGDA
jgi:hypothetical protein